MVYTKVTANKPTKEIKRKSHTTVNPKEDRKRGKGEQRRMGRRQNK